MISAERRKELRRIVREQICGAIRDDLPGGAAGEALMKEAWEQGENEAEFKFMEREMREIIKAIKGMPL